MPRATFPHAITEATLRAAVADAATARAAHDAVRRIADEVVADPRIAGALKPVPPFESQTLRGVAVAAGAPLLVALGRLAGVEIAEGEAAIVASTLVSLIGAAYAWRGRATTTRPLA
ncbi:hypothetical protein [Methylopila turkensis]|uniref:Uncharacterized protein n=1 Tax=Methylopila turkensis TaxID=1437816 RepID=A0A9W6JSD2_9HYPH|nr:hypothetical protein [Methylopila turkensis]GLK81434.1 hypothetical protein GCM10008174_31750 [Methylopila turkensis]